MKMAKMGLSKGLENGQKSVKSQGILKRILSGNPHIFRELIYNGCNLVIIQELSQNSTSNPEDDCVSYITV